MQAPTFVISVTAHGCTPVWPLWPLKNRNALLAIFVLPIALRSFISITRILNKSLIDPAAAVMSAPDFSVNELAANGPSWNEPRDYKDDRISTARRNKARSLSLMQTPRVNSGTVKFAPTRILASGSFVFDGNRFALRGGAFSLGDFGAKLLQFTILISDVLWRFRLLNCLTTARHFSLEK
jgi:hypothetical protein